MPVKQTQVRSVNYFKGALCKGKPVELFFPTKRSNPDLYRKFCGKCPIQEFCLEFSLVFNSYGIWGGLTRSQRARLPRSVVVTAIAHGKRDGWYYIATASAYINELDAFIDRMIDSHTDVAVESRSTVFSFAPPSL